MADDVSTDKGNGGDTQMGTEAQRILKTYLAELKDIRTTGAGVQETSYYPALSYLFNAVGKTLKPKVRCVINIRNQGVGLPDGGLFTADQFQRQADDTPRVGQLPERGAIEAKGTKPAVNVIAASQQVKDYLTAYGIVLVTNLREFVIVDRGPTGEPVVRETFALASTENEFWRVTTGHPHNTAKSLGEPFIEFIKRACLHNAPLTNPKDVAWFLASYARDALFRIEEKKHLPALQTIRSALEEALGMKFAGETGEHFFRSALVQTLFYGVFSAWVYWHRENPRPDAHFDWRMAEWSLHIPFIRILYGQVARASQLGPLNLVEVLDWSAGVLNRVDRGSFFKGFQDEHAVQYFYEPFLEAYDPELRKAMGVWYTPPEIVKYQVTRVDRVLREELDLSDGLADPSVVVLDPCCGTGAYLVEVLHNIAATLRNKGGDALVASDLKKAATNRVFGFEIMPAPFVVAHLQLGLMLQSQGAMLANSERVGVYLTNALTGWKQSDGVKAQAVFPFPELQAERDAAEHVKRNEKILVVLGNPPYNAFAGVSPEEVQEELDVYKGPHFIEKHNKRGGVKRTRRYHLNDPVEMGGWGVKKLNNELYIRFFRLAERRIAEMSGKGIVSFISNHSWIASNSCVLLRERLLKSFDKFWIENLHGDRNISERAPDGRTSETVFAIKGCSVGIKQGVATSLWVRSGKQPNGTAQIFFRDDIDNASASQRRAHLLESLTAKRFQEAYALATPSRDNYYTFRPEDVTAQYNAWPKMVDLCEAAPSNGLMEKRGGALIDIDREALRGRIYDYFNAEFSWEDYKARHKELTDDAGRFVASDARAKAIGSEEFDEDRLRRYAVRPLDTLWCYYTAVRPVWNEPRLRLWRQCFTGNRFVLSRVNRRAKTPEGSPVYFCRGLADDHLLAPDASCFPLLLPPGSGTEAGGLFSGVEPHANLSKAARDYLASLNTVAPDSDAKTAGLIWMHTLAIGYSPAYLAEHADGIRRDWPRIPLPDSGRQLEESAALGEQIAALLDTEAEVPGVTSGQISPLLRSIGANTKNGGGKLDPSGDDLAITAGWGHYGKGKVVMPGGGKYTPRDYNTSESKAIDAEAAVRGLSAQNLRLILGKETLDVYLNGAAYWSNIPLNVWEYYIGGYQIIKKWLSYRDHKILGRAIKPEEAREVMNMARRIAAILLLQSKLDANYRTVAAATYRWPTTTCPPGGPVG